MNNCTMMDNMPDMNMTCDPLTQTLRQVAYIQGGAYGLIQVAVLTFAGFTLFIRRAEWRLKLIWSELLLYSAFQMTAAITYIFMGPMWLQMSSAALSCIFYNLSHWTLGW